MRGTEPLRRALSFSIASFRKACSVCRSARIVLSASGGYAADVNAIVIIHANTIAEAAGRVGELDNLVIG